jgi:hypothetical protein
VINEVTHQLTAQQERFFSDHLPHRVNLLIAFRQRYSCRFPERTLEPEQFRDLYRCAMDISMLMARFFCWEIGLNVPKGGYHIVSCTPRGQSYGAAHADLSIVRQDSRFDQLQKVLIAANRAVAHINPTDVDHSVDADVLISAIDLVESLIQTHIYAANGLKLVDAMDRPNNRM